MVLFCVNTRNRISPAAAALVRILLPARYVKGDDTVYPVTVSNDAASVTVDAFSGTKTTSTDYDAFRSLPDELQPDILTEY